LPEQIVVATCAFPLSYDVEDNLARHLAYIDEAADAGAQLVVFPEISLHGYPSDGSAPTFPDALRRAFDAAEPAPGGERVEAIAAKAAERAIHVVYGIHEAGERRGIIYNTAVLTGPDGHIGNYRKMHVGIKEQMFWRRGNDWPVFDTDLGRIGLLICYDKMWPETCRELTLRGAQLLVMPTAWGRVPGGGEGHDNLLIRNYDLFDRVRAVENQRWLISSNLVGAAGVGDFFGLSNIVSPIGDVVASTGIDHPGLALATIDVEAGLAAPHEVYQGANLIRDRRPESYGCLRGEVPIAIDG